MKNLLTLICVFLCFGCFGFVHAQDVQTLPNAHSHNDYRHDRPTLDALDHGFCSLEADVFLVDGQLLVGHTPWELKEVNTLEVLYLDRLREFFQKNDGSIYPNKEKVVLWIDFKSGPKETWPVLEKVLSNYTEMLSYVEDGKLVEKAVTVIITGSSPSPDMFKSETGKRYALSSDSLDRFDASIPNTVYYAVCENFAKFTRWRGYGELSQEDRQKIAEVVKKTHDQGRKIRFWGYPESEKIWQLMLDLNVDWINTDDHQRLQKFLTK